MLEAELKSLNLKLFQFFFPDNYDQTPYLNKLKFGTEVETVIIKGEFVYEIDPLNHF